MVTKTRLELVMEEVLRPIYGAIDLLRQEIEETMNIPDSPWKILNKSYEQLSDEEIMALLDIYHVQDEQEPCPMCKWMARMEIQQLHKAEV